MKSTIYFLLLLITISKSAQSEFPYEATLTDMEGNEVNSSSFSNNGKPMIIDFWGAFCKPCIVKYNAMMEIYEKWQADTGVKIIIVSIDDERMMNKSKELIKKYEWPFEAYFDSNRDLMGQLTDGQSVPRTFIFDGNNELVYQSNGASITSKDEKVPRSEVMKIMYEGSLSSLSCDLSSYEKEIYKLAEN